MTVLDRLPESWRDRAACRSVDPETFYSDTGNATEIAAAKSICAGCPVTEACFVFAQKYSMSYGVWGGVDFEAPSRNRRRAQYERERKAAARRRAERDAA